MENEKAKQTIENFGDMVTATERLTKPWRIALIVTNVLWAVVMATFIWLAYMSPDTSYQYQDLAGQTQTQSVGSEVSPGGSE